MALPTSHRVQSEDHRSRRIVYVSSCLLNQNRRYPGIAVTEGAMPGLLEPLMKDGIGIEQLPCLECMGWGGVSRVSVFRFLPRLFRYADSPFLPVIRCIARVWLMRYRRLCKRKARQVSKEIGDFVASGYTILGIIAMNDSPTCGVTKTIDILDLVVKSKAQGLTLEDLTSPKLEKMRRLLPNVLKTGRGFFMRELLNEMRLRAIIVPVFEFNPWNDIKGEAEELVGRILDRVRLL